jgi:hypothetical protein
MTTKDCQLLAFANYFENIVMHSALGCVKSKKPRIFIDLFPIHCVLRVLGVFHQEKVH